MAGSTDDEPRVIPPRPPLPPRPAEPRHSQWQAAKDEIGSHVMHARDQIDQANERIKERTGRDLVVAILIGVLIGAAMLSSLIFVKWVFVFIAVLASQLAVYELSRALRAGGRRVDVVPQLLAGLVIVLAAYFVDYGLVWVALFSGVALVIVWRLIGQMAARDGRLYGEVFLDAVVGAFVQIYVPFLTAFALIVLRAERGEWWVLMFIIVAVAADTGAYVSGLLFGRHPMAPRISPKKTWEGFAGAAVAAVLAGSVGGWFLLGLPIWAGVVFGLVILATATLGDLAESMIKRDLGIKDMSSWLPGHGGVLDRLDSILPSALGAAALFFLLTPWAVL